MTTRPRARRVLSAAVIACVAISVAGSRPRSVGAAPTVVSFPGAEGFGASATGGRGGDVVIVDTLEPFGPGSLGDALAPQDCRPRTIVFRVSGVIEVPGQHDLELTCGNLTIAGQTAPGAGITIHGRIDGYGAEPGGNIIIRHLRVRPPPITDEEGAVDDLGLRYDALQLSNNPNLMLDHLSLSWGSDETLDLYEFANDSTVQWTTIEQSNPEGVDEPHNDAMIAGPDSPRVSVHHVLMAHHEARCPAMATGPAELINSVVYDCQDAFVHHNPAEGEFHIAGNTFLQGPSHEEFTPMYFDDEDPGDSTYWLFQNTVVAPGQFEGTVDDIADTPLAEAAFSGADPSQVITTPTDFTGIVDTYQPVTMQAPDDAYESVLAAAGAFPRDQMTTETVDDVRSGGGDWTPNPPDDLLAGLEPTEPPADDDADGIADTWELDHGLDPANGGDHALVMGSGYTAIEEYVNELSDLLLGTSPIGPAADPADPAGSPSAAPTAVPTTDPATAPTTAQTDDDDDFDPLVLAAFGMSVVAVVISIMALVSVRQRRPRVQ